MAYSVVWKNSPNFSGRNGYNPIAIVNHRMVGWLAGTDATFANAANQVSTHFGIGVNKTSGKVEVHQYVDLADAAWGNGNWDASGGWPLVKKTTAGVVINPNQYTVSIEHEDGGTTGRGVVSQEARDASVWLSSLLLSGSPALIRSAGIKARTDEVCAALGKIIPGDETYIDHNRISGKLKPYCWRAWLDDGGFVPAYKPSMLAAVQERTMTIDETLALLAQQINAIEAARDTAIAERNAALAAKATADAALAAIQTRLASAKAKGAEIAAI